MEGHSMLMEQQNQCCEMTITLGEICMFNAILIKIPMTFFKETEKSILKLYTYMERETETVTERPKEYDYNNESRGLQESGRGKKNDRE
jgi:hypothetical protein